MTSITPPAAITAEERPRVGPPRFDPEKRQLLRFYEPLKLLSMLDRTQDADEPKRPRARGFQQIWRQVLDDLCSLCDFDKGGASVCSLVGISRAHGTDFLMGVTSKASSVHLLEILPKLAALNGEDDLTIDRKAEEIARHAIKIGRKKVKNYARFLENAYSRADSTLLDNLAYEKISLLKAELDHLIAADTSNYSLCREAWYFRSQKTLDDIVFSETLRSVNSDWSKIRHLIGRLARWHRASHRLARFAKICPQYFREATVECIKAPPGEVSIQADSKTNLRSAITRMLPARSESRVNHLAETLERMRDFNFEDQFIDFHNNENFQPRVHVEVALLEELYSRELLPDLIGEERYIGCSKPSCYCCNLYMRYHPGNPICGVTHGNIWPQWLPPTPLKVENSKTPTTAGRVMDAVIAHIRRDVIYQIESRQSPRKRRPDSTTGLTVTS